MAGRMDFDKANRADPVIATKARACSAGRLKVARTPAQKIFAEVQRQRLKRDAMRRLDGPS